jgi:ketosteroid isomerase-like protein
MSGEKMMKYFLLLYVLIFQLACSQLPDTEAEKEKLLQTDIEFAQFSVNQGAAEAFNEYLTEDALQLPAGNNPVQGVNNIYNGMKDNQSNYTLDWSPRYAEVAKSGELGYTWGTYSLAYKDKNGEEQKSYGKYLNIWKKQANGNWRVAVDIGNDSPDPDN